MLRVRSWVGSSACLVMLAVAGCSDEVGSPSSLGTKLAGGPTGPVSITALRDRVPPIPGEQPCEKFGTVGEIAAASRDRFRQQLITNPNADPTTRQKLLAQLNEPHQPRGIALATCPREGSVFVFQFEGANDADPISRLPIPYATSQGEDGWQRMDISKELGDQGRCYSLDERSIVGDGVDRSQSCVLAVGPYTLEVSEKMYDSPVTIEEPLDTVARATRIKAWFERLDK